MQLSELRKRFDYHAPDAARAAQHIHVRKSIMELAILLNEWLPEGREKSTVMTHLEDTMFWANAAIAREGS